jgi:hypothetical protein
VSVDELRISIERHLDQVSDEADRLRAALAVLGADDTPPPSIDAMQRSRGSRPQRAAARGATQSTVREARVNGRAPSTGASDGTALRRSTTAPTPSVGSLLDVGRVAENSAARARGGEETALTPTGANRALQELRSELAAGLRNSRSE